MKKTKVTKIIAASLLGMMMVTGCGGGEAKDNNANAEPLTVGLMRIDDSFPFYVAEKEGLFEKHNVAVELQNFSNARDLSTALQGGKLDALMTDTVVTGLSIKGGADVRIVAMALGAVPEEGRFLVISAPDSGITAPEQLAGKNVAISNNTMMDYLIDQFEKELGLENMTTVNMPDLMLRTTTLLEGKDIDAAILPDPLAAFAVAEGANIVIDDTKLGENLSQSVVVVTKENIDDNRAQVEAMLAAYNEAIALINDNPDKYRTFALECANVPEALAETYPTPTFTANCVPTEAQIARVNDWLVEKELLAEPYDYEQMVDDSFMKD
ncbi:MAG: ABC transporter substrate-binding protein [Peptococcaceae bacterium]|nr:ABC transporter substrate-binding protein [Peptococcaceae bacterium]